MKVLLKITNDVLLALDSGSVSLLTLLDLSAAFDAVDHCILLDRLQHMSGISWFSSYLTDRTQSIIVDDHVPQVSSLSYGVPQGSVSGPILFILYTKPLSDLIQCHSIESQSFADDTQLQVSVRPSNIQSAISSLQTCLSDIQTWMLKNKLKLNNDKTEALLLRSSSKSFSVCKPTTISDSGCEISFSSSAKNLGFYIRDDMSVEMHLKNVCRSAYSELRRISTIRHLLSADSTKTLVSAFVLSSFDYCNSLLSGCPKHLLEKLQKVENSAAKLVLKAHKRDHVSLLLRTLHWLPIQARIEYKLSTLCHSFFFSDTAPVYLSDLLRVYSPSRQLRSLSDSRTLRIPHIKTKTFEHRSFSHAAPSV